MELKIMRNKILQLIRIYCPNNTRFYWITDNTDSIGNCRSHYCKKLNEYYDFTIGINKNYALTHSWEDVRRIALQEIAHVRTAGNPDHEMFYDEFNRLMSKFDNPAKSQAA